MASHLRKLSAVLGLLEQEPEAFLQSGAQAKIAIAEGQVKVDGAVETRKRCKIVAGQTVSFAGHSVQVVA
ncbi:ribosome-associated protein [Escherichia coli]|nr:ribosome-associated protein [Escherichia coli]KUV62608.1 ribosome-associated protein [Escherichia coli]KUW00622.1 ribosome-associated protein [Escherichia coli]KZI84843.1 ribosome-associated protein [Escherichia coli]KZJ65893.1 ribosome-associated protein [Escherichia coli]